MNSDPLSSPFGRWPSPISATDVARAGIGLAEPKWDNGSLYWLEGRPSEKGRMVLCRRDQQGQIIECLPKSFSVGSRVHEYGGGAYTVKDGNIAFVNRLDQVVYWQAADSVEPRPLTDAEQGHFADLQIDVPRQRLIAVREVSSGEERHPQAQLVSIALDDSTANIVVLQQGRDFYANPRLSPDGRQLLWLAWDHPYMPWDRSDVWLAEVTPDGTCKEPTELIEAAHKRHDESFFQPEWSPGGDLYAVSDRSGWWNLYRWQFSEKNWRVLYFDEADWGLPQWVFGMRTYAILAKDKIVVARSQGGFWSLGLLTEAGEENCQLQTINTHFTQIEGVVADSERVVCLAGSPEQAMSLIQLTWEEGAPVITVLKTGAALSTEQAENLSAPRIIQFTSEGETAYALYYSPASSAYIGPTGERPPLLVKCHGGPTGMASTALELKIQFWTSRGFAVLDVNYRGSTGFGRAYRDALYGGWGETDVADCVNAARYVADLGWVDESRMVISGNSAGGLTVLNALCQYEVFAAGASYYGISDLEALIAETHKFEAHYTERLVGPYPTDRAVYQKRSPCHALEKIQAPVIFFQGLKDKVVPPDQAEAIVKAMQKKDLPVCYLTFPEEGHGFRQAETIATALQAEYDFYQQELEI